MTHTGCLGATIDTEIGIIGSNPLCCTETPAILLCLDRAYAKAFGLCLVCRLFIRNVIRLGSVNSPEILSINCAEVQSDGGSG
jgi:hypothetical protein